MHTHARTHALTPPPPVLRSRFGESEESSGLLPLLLLGSMLYGASVIILVVYVLLLQAKLDSAKMEVQVVGVSRWSMRFEGDATGRLWVGGSEKEKE